MKKQSIHLLFLIPAIVLGVISLAIFKENIPFVVTSADDYSLSLNTSLLESSQTSFTNASVELDNYQTIDIISGKYFENGVVTLNANGKLYKQEATNGLAAITVNFTGSLKVYSDYEMTFDGTYQCKSLTSGTTTSIYGNYWMLEASAETNIQSVLISYSCLTPAATSDDGQIASYDASGKGSLAGLETINGDTYVWFAATASDLINAHRVPAQGLTIRNDGGDRIIPASHVVYDTDTHFKAYFNLTSWIQSSNGSSMDETPLLCHVYVNDVAISKSDIRVSSAHNLIPGAQAQIAQGKYITLYSTNWGYNDDQMMTLRFSNLDGANGIGDMSYHDELMQRTHVTRNGTILTISHFFQFNDCWFLNPSRFSIKGDGGAYGVTAKSVEVAGYTRVENRNSIMYNINFDINDIVDAVKGELTTSGSKIQITEHLYFDDVIWSEYGGNCIVSETFAQYGKQDWFELTTLGGWNQNDIVPGYIIGFFSNWGCVCIEVQKA